MTKQDYIDLFKNFMDRYTVIRMMYGYYEDTDELFNYTPHRWITELADLATLFGWDKDADDVMSHDEEWLLILESYGYDKGNKYGMYYDRKGKKLNSMETIDKLLKEM